MRLSLGHFWDGPQTLDIIKYGIRTRTAGFRCSRCGFERPMNYILPEAILRFLKVPECDDHIILSVMDQ